MPYNHLNPNRLSNDRRLFAIEYCGNCHGTCDGCALSSSQLNSSTPFTNVFDAESSISPYLRYLDEKGVGNVAVEFGRGNHLTLESKYIDDIISFAENMFYGYGFKHINIEVSTSLIGNFNNQVDVAKKLIDAEQAFDGRVNFKFVIVSNTSIANNNYWNKIKSFMKITATHREEHIIDYAKKNRLPPPPKDIDGCGDILILNVSPKQLPDIHLIYRHISGIKSPINLSWWFNDGMAATITETDIANVEQFLFDFVSYPNFKDIDCSFSETINSFLDTRTSSDKIEMRKMIADSMEKYSIFVNHDGMVIPSFFTPFGLVEAGRVTCVSKETGFKNLDEARDLHVRGLMRSILTSKPCGECPVKDVCIHTGIMNIGMMNMKNLTNGKIEGCPAAARKAIEHLVAEECANDD